VEVTNVLDKVTHAVISPGKVESFEVSDSAEFFHIISDALYSDKPLAVVREVLCNAWDAHIEAGILGTAVDVTLTSEKLIIRDYGSGIPPALIKKIYGTYGNSTKKHDGNQTGGFGLGSKSPFAYVDHFEVTSFCDGEKTIYNMAKSSAVVGGKPSITTLVSVPTDDSGLQVSLNLKNSSDQHRFRLLVMQIASLGEMRVKLNGSLIPTVPFSQAPLGFMFVKQELLGQRTSSAIFVRYGNVVYPVEENEEYQQAYRDVKKFISRIARTPGGYYGGNDIGDWRLVVQAPPHSMSVTPSRESLSMTDRTLETIKRLLANVLDRQLSSRLDQKCTEITEEAVKASFIMGRPVDLILDRLGKFPLPKVLGEDRANYLVDFDNISRMFLRHTYPDIPGFRERDFLNRLDSIIMSGFGRRGLVQSFKRWYLHLRELDKLGRRRSWDGRQSQEGKWFASKVLWPVLKLVRGEPLLNEKNLYVYTDQVNRVGRTRFSEGPEFTPWKQFRVQSHDQLLPFTRGLILIGYNRQDIIDRIDQFPVIKFWMGTAVNSLVLTVPRAGNRGEVAVKAFQDAGYTVVDLTKRHSWEPEWVTQVDPDKVRPKKVKRPKGLPLGSQLLDLGKLTTNIVYAYDPDDPKQHPKMIENPQVIFRTGHKEKLEGLGHFSTPTTVAIVRLFGDVAGVALSTVQEAKYLAQGASEMEPYVRARLVEEFKNNPEIEKHFRNYGKRELNHNGVQLLKVVRQDAGLRAHFKLPNPYGQRERDFILLYRAYDSYHYQHKHPEIREIAQLVEKTWTPSPELQAYKKIVESAGLLRILDLDDVKTILVGGYPDSQKNAVREALLRIIKG
jgi:hypothetical protein